MNPPHLPKGGSQLTPHIVRRSISGERHAIPVLIEVHVLLDQFGELHPAMGMLCLTNAGKTKLVPKAAIKLTLQRLVEEERRRSADTHRGNSAKSSQVQGIMSWSSLELH